MFSAPPPPPLSNNFEFRSPWYHVGLGFSFVLIQTCPEKIPAVKFVKNGMESPKGYPASGQVIYAC